MYHQEIVKTRMTTILVAVKKDSTNHSHNMYSYSVQFYRVSTTFGNARMRRLGTYFVPIRKKYGLGGDKSVQWSTGYAYADHIKL